jgi:hypothetical protein
LYFSIGEWVKNSRGSVPAGALDASSVGVPDGERRLAGKGRWLLRLSVVRHRTLLRARFSDLQNE